MKGREITVDRIEGNRAVLVVAGEAVEVPTSALPQRACEGSILELTLGDDRAIRSSAEERIRRLTAASTVPDTFDL